MSLRVLLLLALVPTMASAATVDQIVTLSKAGVSDSVVLALIDRDKSVFAIEPEQLVALKRAGVSEAVVLAMLKSGRQPQLDAATVLPLVGPETIIVGHGPDVPNTTRRGAFTTATAEAVPYLFIGPLFRPGCQANVTRTATAPVTPMFGRFMSDPTARFTNNGFIPAEEINASSSLAVDCAQAAPHRHRSLR